MMSRALSVMQVARFLLQIKPRLYATLFLGTVGLLKCFCNSGVADINANSLRIYWEMILCHILLH